MLMYREMAISEADRIAEIDATNYIKNVWRRNAQTNEYELTEINWTDSELPNGFDWHLQRFKEAVQDGGRAFGCFDGDVLVGYTVIGGNIFGRADKYILLDQLFVSNSYRGKGIGKALFSLCAEQARKTGAEKLYLCADSSENTIAFYHKLGCRSAVEVDEELLEEDPNDIQLEFELKV